jgi:hypothetical protein
MLEEAKAAIRKLGNNRAPGPDVNAELINLGAPELIHKMMNKVWTTERRKKIL